MPSMRDKFPGQPGEELPIEIQDEQETVPRFDPDQHRAFGSAPALLGKDFDVPQFERLSPEAWQRTESTTLRAGLYRPSGKYEVNGLALSPEYHEAIIRNQKAFVASTGAKTVAANRLSHPERQQEKFDKSQTEPLMSKHARHQVIIDDLRTQQDNLETLLGWQRTPGFWRTDEVDLRLRATQAWQQTFLGMLRTLKDNYELTTNQELDMQQAAAYRLFRGPQSERVKQWGDYLNLGNDYTKGVRLLFEQSDRKIGHALTERAVEPSSE
ncbi:MAG: hypothetical protein V4678_04285 [Patescibacteria group bacterium]